MSLSTDQCSFTSLCREETHRSWSQYLSRFLLEAYQLESSKNCETVIFYLLGAMLY